ncbi:hypothetical protein J4461_01775 [Candidatus Pacearchaeota archaeon]|nr:hypothetical protein [Candidatus Pacearchaeota archaeon]
MKHSAIITYILVVMFLIAQIIGLAVIAAYSPVIEEVQDENGTILNVTHYNMPYGTNPPQDTNEKYTLISIITAFIIALALMVLLMSLRAETFLRIWFFVVVVLAIGITINAAIQSIPYSSFIALLISLPLAYLKIFKRHIVVHNFTELLIYPGIASIFVPLLNIWTTLILLVIISLYDIYAVWHTGFMQKMARYQIKKLRVFSGLFIPYIHNKIKLIRSKSNASKKSIKVNVAILGGGDIVFPIIVAGVVLRQFGLVPAIIVSLGATIALSILFYFSEKGKFYPAMPFISAGCFAAIGLIYIIY